MKISAVLFALVLGLCLLLGIALMSEQPSGAAGVPHPDYPTMLQGGDPQRHAPVLWLGWAMGLVQLAFFVGLLAFGTRGRGSFPTEDRILVAGFVIFGLVFSAMMMSYAATMDGSRPALVLGFPLPTSLMFYGVGGAPLIFILLFMVRFDPWILTDDQLAEFRRKHIDTAGSGSGDGAGGGHE